MNFLAKQRRKMRIKDIKIISQLNFIQVLVIVTVLIFATYSYFAIDRLWKNMESFNSHPFTVQKALSAIEKDIFQMRLTMEEIVLQDEATLNQTYTIAFALYDSDSLNQIETLYSAYLGPKSDIDKIKKLVTEYKTMRFETIKLISLGKTEEAKQRVRFDGVCGVQAREIIRAVDVMKVFANSKAKEFFEDSKTLKSNALIILIILMLSIVILCNIIIISLKRNILPPLNELRRAIDDFKQGKQKSLSNYQSLNELGIVTSAFNYMTEKISIQDAERIKDAAALLSANNEISSQAELIKVQEEFFIEKQLFEAILVSIGDAVISCDISCNIVFLNKVAEQITGWAQQDAIGKPVEEVFKIYDEYSREKSEDIIKKVLQSSKSHELASNTILINKYDLEIPIEDSAAPIFKANGQIIGVVLVFRDVSDKRQKLKNIEFLSYHDKLTELYNRRFYEEEIVRIDTGRNLPLTIAMGDLNGLKLVNDSFGHMIGDELLIKAAKAIKNGCRADDIIARLGGDEFIIILPKTNRIEAETIIERIKKNIANEKVKDLEVSIAFGHGTKDDPNQDIQEIFKIAEDDMYKQKLYESSSIRSKTVDLIKNTLYEKNEREMLHSNRVSEFCEAIAREMGFEIDEVNQIKLAGQMHDIGKIGIDDRIIDKVEKITEAEFNEIKRHSEIGFRILSSVNEFSEIAVFVLEHHERWDGKGYPKGLIGEEISIPARIIAIADSFDAMTRERTYKDTLSIEEAIVEMERCSGTQFDPVIVKVFIERVLKAN
jgi:diguanylate cyclase (GGDEF)-like protein/PAS domain S-box-containing protein